MFLWRDRCLSLSTKDYNSKEGKTENVWLARGYFLQVKFKIHSVEQLAWSTGFFKKENRSFSVKGSLFLISLT